MQLNVPPVKITINKQYFFISTGNDSTQCCGRGRCQKHRKFNVQDKDRGAGTIYRIKAELIAAAIVTIFGFILIAAAIVTAFGNNSSCYYPQPWELRHI